MTNKEVEALINRNKKHHADDIIGAVSLAILVIVLAHI